MAEPQLSVRSAKARDLAHRLNDDDIEAFFTLARTDGIMPIVRQTARFNQHRDFIVALLRQRSRPYLFSNTLPPAV
jgi:hypothetical protein